MYLIPAVAGFGAWAHHGPVNGTSASFLVGPLIAFAGLGILVLLLRWTFRSGVSVVAKRPKPGTDDEYGLLVTVASPGTYVEGEILRRTLEDAKIRATLTHTLSGPRVMVFPDDEAQARAVLDRS